MEDSDSDTIDSTQPNESFSQIARTAAQIDREIREMRDKNASIDDLLKTQPDTVNYNSKNSAILKPLRLQWA